MATERSASPDGVGRLDHGRHQHQRWSRPCLILDLRGMSRRLLTATASPTSRGSPTTGRRRSGSWTAPTSAVEQPSPILDPPGISPRRLISTATATPIFFRSTTAARRRSVTMDGTNIIDAAILPNPGHDWHIYLGHHFRFDEIRPWRSLYVLCEGCLVFLEPDAIKNDPISCPSGNCNSQGTT